MDTPEQKQKYIELIAEMQATVRSHKNAQNTPEEAYLTQFPVAISATPIEQIGVIVDDQFTVSQLFSVGKINPPTNIFWIHVKTYDELENFFRNRGIPNYISFDTSLSTTDSKAKNGYDCAKLLIKECKAKGVELPQWECHSPVISKKQQIEMLLFDY
jgi:hypothetical protein